MKNIQFLLQRRKLCSSTNSHSTERQNLPAFVSVHTPRSTTLLKHWTRFKTRYVYMLPWMQSNGHCLSSYLAFIVVLGWKSSCSWLLDPPTFHLMVSCSWQKGWEILWLVLWVLTTRTSSARWRALQSREWKVWVAHWDTLQILTYQ